MNRLQPYFDDIINKTTNVIKNTKYCHEREFLTTIENYKIAVERAKKNSHHKENNGEFRGGECSDYSYEFPRSPALVLVSRGL